MQALKQANRTWRACTETWQTSFPSFLQQVHVGLMIYVLLMVGVLGARGAEFSLPLVVLLLLGVSAQTCPDMTSVRARRHSE